jgi:hypothetical protein
VIPVTADGRLDECGAAVKRLIEDGVFVRARAFVIGGQRPCGFGVAAVERPA